MAQKSQDAEDLRVRRTRILLQKALIELALEKGFAAITINDLTERAMVNRSTFYRHYLDKYDLLHQYMDEVYELASASVDEQAEPNSRSSPSGLVSLLRHVAQFSDFYRVMLGPQGDPVFIQRLRQNAEKRFRYLLSSRFGQVNPNTPPADLRVSYVSYAGVGAILWWLENNQPCTPEQLAEWLSQLSIASMSL